MGAITSVHGDEWKPAFPLCISGHIHEYQQPYHNLIYPGTPIQLGYGVPPSKGVMIITVNGDSDSIAITHSFIDLGLPRKLIVHLTPEQLSTYTLPENSFVKLVCKGDTKVIREIIKLDNVKEMLKNPRVKLSIQEERKKKPENFTVKTETVAFQKRLTEVIERQTPEVKSLFTSLFGGV
jgi:DNA repair exonuclease SbcCD nuclease subunit